MYLIVDVIDFPIVSNNGNPLILLNKAIKMILFCIKSHTTLYYYQDMQLMELILALLFKSVSFITATTKS